MRKCPVTPTRSAIRDIIKTKSGRIRKINVANDVRTTIRAVKDLAEATICRCSRHTITTINTCNKSGLNNKTLPAVKWFLITVTIRSTATGICKEVQCLISIEMTADQDMDTADVSPIIIHINKRKEPTIKTGEVTATVKMATGLIRIYNTKAIIKRLSISGRVRIRDENTVKNSNTVSRIIIRVSAGTSRIIKVVFNNSRTP